MEPKLIQFQFKGDRKYLHGTDIYDALMREISSKISVGITDFKMAILKKSDCHQIFYIGKDMELTDLAKTASVRASFKDGETNWLALLVSDEKKIDSSYAFDEEKIRNCINYNGEEIVCEKKMFFSVIEIIVAMNKYLLEKKIKDYEGSYYFVRLDLDKSLKENYNQIKIKEEQFRKNSMLKSAVYIDHSKIGSIYFTTA